MEVKNISHVSRITFLINRKEFYRFYFSITELEGGKFD